MTLTHIAIDSIEFGKKAWWKRLKDRLLRRVPCYEVPQLCFHSPDGGTVVSVNIDRAVLLRPQPMEIPVDFRPIHRNWAIEVINTNEIPISLHLRVWGETHIKCHDILAEPYQEVSHK